MLLLFIGYENYNFIGRIYVNLYKRSSMRKLIALFMICILMSACSGSRGCGCPSWGKIDVDQNKLQIQQVRMENSDGWLWL